MQLEDKIDVVKNILKDKKVALGFSGGADSTLMAYLSSEVASDTLAITIDNHLFSQGFIENTKRIAESFGIRHEVIDINFYEDESFLLNDSTRCYGCRNLMYEKIEDLAYREGFDFICDGNNISDLVIDRPGILITYAKGFKTPFIEARLSSKEIHEYLDWKNISYSKSTTCLATRIPTDTEVTPEKIERVSYCEDYILANSSCEIVKVRDLGKSCRIEVDNLEEIQKDEVFDDVSSELKRQGFKNVELDLKEIDDDEFISLDYRDGSFSYQLPFTISIENTNEQLDGEILSKNGAEISLDNIKIFENGLIEGNGFESYEKALDSFMQLLPKLRRNI